MSDLPREFAPLKEAFPAATLESEGGKPLVLIPDLVFRTAEKKLKMDVLLHPRAEQGSYFTRLYFKHQFAHPNASWSQQTVLGSSWWVISWKDVPCHLPWLQILFAHLRAFA